MARFDSAIALAKRLITKNGQQVTLRTFTAGTPADSNKPWKPGTNVPVNQTAMAVFLDYSQSYITGFQSLGLQVGAEPIRAGDQRVFMPADGLTSPPTVEGLLLRGSETWKIMAVKPLNPNGQAIMYEMQVRQ